MTRYLQRLAVLARAIGLGASLMLPLVSGCYGLPPEAPASAAPTDWNAREIAWLSYAEGLAAGKAQHRPIVLIFYTDWCPHCHNYSRLFHVAELVRLAREFVMIRVERDGNRDISEVYDLDGEYIPRTFFLSSSGLVLTDLASGSDEYRYFLDEHDPTMLIDLMQRALRRFAAPPRGP